MVLDKPWAIFRPKPGGTLELVHQAEKLQDARYWLMYIATVGDALFKTPFHNRYVGSGNPTYESHLEQRQKSEHNEAKWHKQVGIEGLEIQFVYSPESAPDVRGAQEQKAEG